MTRGASGYAGRVDRRLDPPQARLLPALFVLGVSCLGAWLRGRGLGSLFLYGDELHSLPLVGAGYGEILRSFEPLGSGIALPLVQRVSTDLFGASLWALRLPMWLAGSLAPPLAYCVARRLLGTAAGLLAATALALDPLHVFHSHFARAYTLGVLLALGLVYALARVLEAPASARRWWLAVAASAGLLPYVHLTLASFVVSVAAGAGAVTLFDARARAARRPLLLGFVGGLLLTIVLYLPAWEPLREFLANKAANRPSSLPFDVVDLAAQLAGSRPAALGWLLAVPPAAVWMLRARRQAALLLLSAALLPVVALAVVRPVGGIHAYARYLLTISPFVTMLLAGGLVALCRRVSGGARLADAAAVGVGVLLLGAACLAGPLGRAHDGPYANLPRAPDAEAARGEGVRLPAFYRVLAAREPDARIVETPAFVDTQLDLYHAYFLEHRLDTRLGVLGDSGLERFPGAYLEADDAAALRAGGADYLILHRDVRTERSRARGRVTAAKRRPLASASEAGLRAVHGAPIYRDPDIVVWKLR